MNNKIFAVACCFALVTLGGCAVSEEIEAKKAKRNGTFPICSTEAECSTMWEASQLWVVQNAGYKLQIATDVVLETFNSTGSSTALAVQVTKQPMGGGNYRIVIDAWCANIFGCVPDALDSEIAFNQYVLNSL